jgi:hypothetical protein
VLWYPVCITSLSLFPLLLVVSSFSSRHDVGGFRFLIVSPQNFRVYHVQCVGFVMCVCVWVLVACVLVFTVFWYCFIYVHAGYSLCAFA